MMTIPYYSNNNTPDLNCVIISIVGCAMAQSVRPASVHGGSWQDATDTKPRTFVFRICGSYPDDFDIVVFCFVLWHIVICPQKLLPHFLPTLAVLIEHIFCPKVDGADPHFGLT